MFRTQWVDDKNEPPCNVCSFWTTAQQNAVYHHRWLCFHHPSICHASQSRSLEVHPKMAAHEGRTKDMQIEAWLPSPSLSHFKRTCSFHRTRILALAQAVATAINWVGLWGEAVREVDMRGVIEPHGAGRFRHPFEKWRFGMGVEPWSFRAEMASFFFSIQGQGRPQLVA